MTAFAGSEIEIGQLALSCELRSVNHRYCDIIVKLPDRFRFAETDIRTVITAKLKRGKIECSIGYSKQLVNSCFSVNLDTVKALLATVGTVESLMSNPQPFSALEVLAFPGVQQQAETDRETLHEKLIEMLDQALLTMLEVRAREGAQLALLIEDRCHKVLTLVDAAEQRLPDVLSQIRGKLTNRIIELVADPNFDRLEQELVLLAQKLDVAEEIDRLKTHVTEVLRALTQGEPVGRRLDFLMQEMNREANTLGSKSADKDMTQIAIDLKVLIEQMREQIQNIE